MHQWQHNQNKKKNNTQLLHDLYIKHLKNEFQVFSQFPAFSNTKFAYVGVNTACRNSSEYN